MSTSIRLVSWIMFQQGICSAAKEQRKQEAKDQAESTGCLQDFWKLPQRFLSHQPHLSHTFLKTSMHASTPPHLYIHTKVLLLWGEKEPQGIVLKNSCELSIVNLMFNLLLLFSLFLITTWTLPTNQGHPCYPRLEDTLPASAGLPFSDIVHTMLSHHCSPLHIS